MVVIDIEMAEKGDTALFRFVECCKLMNCPLPLHRLLSQHSHFWDEQSSSFEDDLFSASAREAILRKAFATDL